jgi:hypothetical protein
MYAAPMYGQPQQLPVYSPSQQQQLQPGPLQQTMQVEGAPTPQQLQQQEQELKLSAPMPTPVSAAAAAVAPYPASPSAAMHVVGGSYVQVAAAPVVVASFSPSEARFCSSCGAARVDPNGRFCASCGVLVPTTAVTGAAPAAATTMS